jgi:dGTPase
MYRHERVNKMNQWAAEIVKGLFSRYMDNPALLPVAWKEKASGAEPVLRARLVGDYVAGMTDRFAESEYRRLSGQG